MSFKVLKTYRSKLIASVICGFIVSFAFVFGYQISFTQTISLSGWTFLTLLGGLILGAALFMALWIGLDKLQAYLARPERKASCLLNYPKATPILTWIILLICWTPILLAGFPGYFTYDAGTGDLMQWGQIEKGVLNAHHPILHTLFLEITIKAGMALGGTFNAGVFLSVAIQAVIISGLFTFALHWLQREGVGTVGYLLAGIYLALDPIVSLFALTTTKDSLFAALLLIYCIQLFNLSKRVVAPPTFKERIISGLPMALICFLILALRMNAVVAMVIIIPLACIVLKKSKQISTYLISTALSLILTFLWLGPISLALHVEKSPIGFWNSMCIPMQQMARCSTDSHVSEEDKQLIEEDLPGIRYQPDLSDISRDAFLGPNRCSTSDLLHLYLYLGSKYPSVYFEAALAQTEDAWSPFGIMDCYRIYEPDNPTLSNVFEMYQHPPSERESLFPGLLRGITWFAHNRTFESIPLLNLFVSIPFYLLVLIICITYSLLSKNRSALAFLIPLLALSISNLFGPCMLIRYFLYLFFAFPFMVLIILKPSQQNLPKHLKPHKIADHED